MAAILPFSPYDSAESLIGRPSARLERGTGAGRATVFGRCATRRSARRRARSRRGRSRRTSGGASAGRGHRGIPPRVVLTAAFVLGAGIAAASGAAGPRGDAAGGSVAIGPGEVHSRDLDLGAGEFVHLVVDQQGVDLAIELRDPRERLLIRVDSPNGENGPEELVAIAGDPGAYRFEIAAPEGSPGAGRYRFRIAARRVATAADRELVAADRSYHRARQLRKAGREDEALEGLRAALAAFRRLGLTGREADALREQALAHRSQGTLELTALFAERAAELYRARGDALQAAAALATSGQSRLKLGQPERARAPLEEAIRLYEEAGWKQGVALAGGFLGVAEFELGRLQRALDRLERAAALSRDLDDDVGEALALCDLGPVLLALGRAEEALSGYERAVAIFAGSGSGNRGVALAGVAQAAVQLGDHNRAEAALGEALALLVEPGARADRAIALRTLGDLRRRRSDWNGSRGAYAEALELARSVGDRRTEALLLLETGHLETLSGSPARGLQLHDQARAGFAALDDRRGEAAALARGAQSLTEMGRFKEAWERLAPALEVIESLRTATRRSDFRGSYFAFRQDYYEIALDVLMNLHRAEPEAGHHAEAFRLNERRLARELVDDLAGEAAEPDPDPALAAEERRLEEELADLASSPGRGPGDPAVAALLARLHTVRGRLWSGGVASPAAEVVSADEARRALLDEETVLLVYALGEERSHLWCLTAERLSASDLPGRSEIESLASAFTRLVGEPHRLAAGARSRLGARLGRMLLQPVADRLAGRRLVVVAGGALQRLPFAALPSPAASGRHLIEDHEIVLLPSVSTLDVLRRRDRPRPAGQVRIAAFADPVYGTGDQRVSAAPGAPDSPPAELTRAAGEVGIESFERLRHSRDEVDGILALAPGRRHLVATGFDASREALSASDLTGFGVLHFATHALVHPVHPELSGLVLTLVDREGRPRNGFLRAFEISGLRLPAELVVLSACESGVGRDLRGEGMASLARSFFHAGALRVVSTLWRVTDRWTATLMVGFYRELLVGDRSPPAALRAAQLAVLRQTSTSEPYYWAGFTFQGDWREVRW